MAAVGEYELAAQSRHVVCQIGDNPIHTLERHSEADIDFYVREFERTGFRGGLNWYRNIDRNWELSAPFEGAKVTVPALYMAGDRDLVEADEVERVLPEVDPDRGDDPSCLLRCAHRMLRWPCFTPPSLSPAD